MTRPLTFTARVTGGRLPLAYGQQFAALLRASEGELVTVSVGPAKRRRSLSQNAYYWAAVVPPVLAAFRDAGNGVDADDVHEFLKTHVGRLRQVFVTPDGEVLRTAGSTAKLTKREFGDYLTACIAWAAEHGIDVPPADQFHHTTNQEKEAACQEA